MLDVEENEPVIGEDGVQEDAFQDNPNKFNLQVDDID